MNKFSENYINAQVTNSQGKPVSPQHLEDRAKDQAYLREMQQLINEYATKPWDEFGAKRYREIFLKHHSKSPVMQEYHEKLQGGAADGIPDSEFDPEALAEGTKDEFKEHMSDMGSEGMEMASEEAKDHLELYGKDYYKKLDKIEGK